MDGDHLEALDSSSEALHSEVTMVVTGEPPGSLEEELEEEEEEETAPEVIDYLSLLDVLRVSTIMEDVIDQLSILGYIIPVPYERKQSISQKASHEKPSAVSSTRKLSLPLSEMKQRGQDLILKKPTRQTIINLETLKKIQNDRQYFSDVIATAMKEMQDFGSFKSLLEALGRERDNRMNFHEAITREEKGRRQIKFLQRQLIDVKKERQVQVQNGNEYIAHLKDQLQEMKAKTNLENLYMKRNTELQISQTQKKCSRAEEHLLEEIEKLRMKTEEENRVHTEIELFLKKEQQIREYEQVIIEDRLEKEKMRKKKQQDDLELKSIVKLQAWWRGTVVRREIGSFKMPRKEKEDIKDSKGKEKEKRRGKK
ncbi:dynein regulatory complex protein 9 isoform X2 [Cricetulus griseus]|uniref:Dynein regulatory complex protein 9 n=1 Tax=Cricetulus griseus TaxID=10029 RepID=A0A9J7FVX2_CRIGR|nr:dynein regulatory complex protein 9 isoform X2 [Cricetulus griseus]XP_027268614.1 dynein regulatory complex protein 9 isoform X2 [Cricetulus griseus]